MRSMSCLPAFRLVAAFLLLYVLSIGSAVSLMLRVHPRATINVVAEVVYAPLAWLCDNSSASLQSLIRTSPCFHRSGQLHTAMSRTRGRPTCQPAGSWLRRPAGSLGLRLRSVTSATGNCVLW